MSTYKRVGEAVGIALYAVPVMGALLLTAMFLPHSGNEEQMNVLQFYSLLRLRANN